MQARELFDSTALRRRLTQLPRSVGTFDASNLPEPSGTQTKRNGGTK
jgi:hypothetical protein